MAKTILTIKEVAARLHCSDSMIRKLAQLGKFPHFRIGKLWRFDESEVDAWIEANSAKVAGK